jgi:hypothetical protein
MIVYLVWFSSLTHMACLTSSRGCLFHHPRERAWRLLAMGIIVILLITALIPTGNFDWFENGYANGNKPYD